MKSFWEYLQERFPPLVNGLLILSYFSANYLLARGLFRPDEPLPLSYRFPLGYLVLLLFAYPWETLSAAVLAYLVFLPLSARAYARRARLEETRSGTPPA